MTFGQRNELFSRVAACSRRRLFIIFLIGWAFNQVDAYSRGHLIKGVLNQGIAVCKITRREADDVSNEKNFHSITSPNF